MFETPEELISEVYEKRDVFDFRKYLTYGEERQFLAEEDKLHIARLDMIKKYNKIVSDKLSHSVLLEEIQKILSCSSEKFKTTLDLLDNKTLQTILSVIMLANKENKVVVNEEKKI